jgi:hypothetical protein
VAKAVSIRPFNAVPDDVKDCGNLYQRRVLELMRKGGWLDETTKCKASISSGRSGEKRQARKIGTGNKVMRDKKHRIKMHQHMPGPLNQTICQKVKSEVVVS